MERLWDRMVLAAKLDTHLYEEVEADRDATKDAAVVVLLSGLAAGVGQLSRDGLSGLILGTLAALLSWLIWAFLVYFIGTRVLPEPQTRADYGELLRTLGFASAPGLIRVLGIIPFLYAIVEVLAALWMLAAMVIAVRQALDYSSTSRAVAVCAIGLAVVLLIRLIL